MSEDKKVDVLTEKYIEQSKYFRVYLYGNDRRSLEGLNPRERLYLMLRDKYYEIPSYDYSDLFKNNLVQPFLSEEEKVFFGVDGEKEFKGISDEKLDELFFGKPLTDTVKMFRE
jgi:hypothetical protein